MNRYETEEVVNEHPVLVFFLVATVVFAMLFVIAQATSGSEKHDQGGGTPLGAQTPSGGGGAAAAPVLEAAAPVEAAPAEPLAVLPAEAPAAPVVEVPAIPPALPPTAPPPAVSASAYAVVERGCGQLSFGFNEHERLAPASLTKIVTSLIVARSANLDDMVDITVSGSAMRKQGSSIMGIEPGQSYSMRDLLYGLMLPSGNDAAMAIAQHLGGGDVNRFVEMMNEEARTLGMVDSHFSNPHGLDSRTLYSSAYDMALAGRAALDSPLLWDVSNARSYTTSSGLSFRNGNKLLSSYAGAYGVKIGFTNAAKQTIVAAAERDGRAIVVSVFGSGDRYADSTAILNWAFDHVPPRC
jgi:D-alanyl-D-alanine carboxypeptidase